MNRALISLINNFNVLTQIFLKSHNERKHKSFPVAGKFILTNYLEKKNSAVDKEEEKKLAELTIEIQNHAGYGQHLHPKEYMK